MGLGLFGLGLGCGQCVLHWVAIGLIVALCLIFPSSSFGFLARVWRWFGICWLGMFDVAFSVIWWFYCGLFGSRLVGCLGYCG